MSHDVVSIQWMAISTANSFRTKKGAMLVCYEGGTAATRVSYTNLLSTIAGIGLIYMLPSISSIELSFSCHTAGFAMTP